MEQNKTREYNEFAIPLSPSTDLGMAMLIFEDEEGHYEPVAIAASIGEAREIAANDKRERTRRLERDQDPGICPWCYKLWARWTGGVYGIAIEIPA